MIKLKTTTIEAIVVIVLLGWWHPCALGDTAGEKAVAADGHVDDRIDALVQQLAHPNFQSREAARWELQRIGLPAYEKLRDATFSANAEIASAAQYMIQSFKVVWWLDSDSLAVRQLLRDFDDLSATDCAMRLQQLAEQQSADGFQALVRLARYESHEQLSKTAALCLMEAWLQPRRAWSRTDLAAWIRQGIEGSSRPSALWLIEFARVLDDERSEAEAWRSFAAREHALVAGKPNAVGEQIAARLYAWIGQWLAQTGRRELALELSRPRLELVSTERSLVLGAAHWALDSNLPELVEELAQAHPDQFTSQAQFRYLLAESYLKSGRVEAARKTAQEASDIMDFSQREKPVPNGRLPADNESSIRMSMYGKLLDRGLFDWAEAELLRALRLEIMPDIEILGRQYLSDFYWDAGANDLAAKALEASIKKSKEQPDYYDQLKRLAKSDRQDTLEDITGNWHFFRGLASIDRGDEAAARKELDLAFEKIPQNPDVLIAMFKVAGDGSEYAHRVEQRIDQKVDEYRSQVLSEEQTLAREHVRRERNQIEEKLARSCNELAWLLSCTLRSPREAISLSQRSLTLSPNSSTYLDTLGRCYFAAGDFQKAVEAQAQAVQIEPYRRQMQRQLAEFQSAAELRPTTQP